MIKQQDAFSRNKHQASSPLPAVFAASGLNELSFFCLIKRTKNQGYDHLPKTPRTERTITEGKQAVIVQRLRSRSPWIDGTVESGSFYGWHFHDERWSLGSTSAQASQSFTPLPVF